MPYLMGIDNGGTFVKAGIVDENGLLLAVAREPVHNQTPEPGFTERDMDDLWKQNVKVIRKAIALSGIAPEDIAGISFSGHGKGLYLVDEKGRPAYQGILSTDTRAWDYVRNWSRNGTKEQVFKKTCQDILASQPVSLLAWLQDHNPEILIKAKYIFSVKDYIRYMLTGEAYGEYTDFSGANLVNLFTRSYDMELLALFGLRDVFERLPPLKYSAELCGSITKEAAQITGLKAGTPVAAGMFDINACGLSAGLNQEETLCMIAGTWSINEYIATNPVTNGTVALNSMYCIPGYYLIEESSPTSAGNMQWFIDKFLTYEKQEEEKKNSDIYERANSLVEKIEPQDCNVIFLPFLNGSHEDALAKGTFTGMTDYHTKAHLLRAVYEGIVFSHVTHVNRLLQNREKPKAVRLVGGAAKSKVWVRIFADVLQLPIETVVCEEPGILGAAIAAGVACGVYENYAQASKKTVKIQEIVRPRSEYREIYEKKYNCYLAVVAGLSGVWEHFN